MAGAGDLEVADRRGGLGDGLRSAAWEGLVPITDWVGEEGLEAKRPAVTAGAVTAAFPDALDELRQVLSFRAGLRKESRRSFRLRDSGAEPLCTQGSQQRTIVQVSDAAHRQDEAPHGTALLPSDLNEEQLAAAPALVSIDTLLIEELSEEEDDAFAAALDS